MTEQLDARNRVRQNVLDYVEQLSRPQEIDPEEGNEIVRAFCAALGRKHPQKIVWCDSPVTTLVASTMYQSIYHWRCHNNLGNFTQQLSNAWTALERVRTTGGNLTGHARSEARSVQSSNGWIRALEWAIQRKCNALDPCFPARKTRADWWNRISNHLGDRAMLHARRNLRSIWQDDGPDERVYGLTNRVVDDAIDRVHLALDERVKNDKEYTRHGIIFMPSYYPSLATYQGLRDVPEIRASDHWKLLNRVAQFALAFDAICYNEDVVFVSRRPIHLRLNDAHQLHSINFPAIEYADGIKEYLANNTVIPREWVEVPGFLTPRRALGQRNVELRRAACEILGWDKVIADLGGRVINKDRDPQIGTLLEVRIPGVGRARFIRVQCGTGRTFAIPVPVSTRTAKEGNAWTYGRTERNFVPPEVRT